jgi:hypothetical protein
MRAAFGFQRGVAGAICRWQQVSINDACLLGPEVE